MTRIEGRKADHINIALEQDICPKYRYWEDVKLIHEALPEVDYDEIDTSADVLGKKLDFPFIVTAITGGFEGAKRINENIAKACAEMGVGMGVGSERAAIEGIDKESYRIINDYDVPLVIGNVGAPQLVEQKNRRAFTSEDVAAAKDLINADYMAVHLNFLQECVQPEGDLNGKGCYDAIRSLAREFPIIVKETGAGMSPRTIARLEGIGVEAVDIGGMGGTSFSAIEMHRAANENNGLKQELGFTYFDWGIPAPVSLMKAGTQLPVIASGGILTGLDAAKSIALGAVCAGGAYVILQEATESAEAVMAVLELMKEEFKTAMMLTGCRNVEELSKADYLTTGETRQWLEGFE